MKKGGSFLWRYRIVFASALLCAALAGGITLAFTYVPTALEKPIPLLLFLFALLFSFFLLYLSEKRAEGSLPRRFLTWQRGPLPYLPSLLVSLIASLFCYFALPLTAGNLRLTVFSLSATAVSLSFLLLRMLTFFCDLILSWGAGKRSPTASQNSNKEEPL